MDNNEAALERSAVCAMDNGHWYVHAAVLLLLKKHHLLSKALMAAHLRILLAGMLKLFWALLLHTVHTRVHLPFKLLI